MPEATADTKSSLFSLDWIVSTFHVSFFFFFFYFIPFIWRFTNFKLGDKVLSVFDLCWSLCVSDVMRAKMLHPTKYITAESKCEV